VKKLLIALLVAGLLLAGVAWKVSRSNSNGGQEEYTFAAAEFGTMKETVGATGALQPKDVVAVGSQVSGQVEELYADYNSVVKHGQLLARLDRRNYQAQLDNSDAAVASAQAHVLSADADVKNQAANLVSAKANLEAARVTRENNAILFSGTRI